MGYRSDVYIKVHEMDEDKLVEVLKKNEFTAIKEYSGKNHVGYIINYVKWYSSYDDVKAVNDFIEEKSEYPKGLIAIGEDNAKEDYGKPWEVGIYAITRIDWE